MKKMSFTAILLLAVFIASNSLAQNVKEDLEKEGLALEANTKGQKCLDDKKYDEALMEFNRAIELKPSDWLAYGGRASVYHVKGDYKKEISELNKVIELNPNFLESYCSRAYAYNAIGDSDQAILDYTKVIEQSSNNYMVATSYNNRALAYYAKKEYGKALEDMRKAESLGYEVDKQFIQSLEKLIN